MTQNYIEKIGSSPHTKEFGRGISGETDHPLDFPLEDFRSSSSNDSNILFYNDS